MPPLRIISPSNGQSSAGEHAMGKCAGLASGSQGLTDPDEGSGEGFDVAEVDEVAVVGDGTWSPPKKGPASSLKKQVSSAFKYFGLGMGQS